MNLQEAAKNPLALKFRIPDRPTPLARARMGRNRVFDPQKDRKLVIGLAIRQQMEERELLDEPIFVFMDFYFTPPGNSSQARQDALMGQPYPKRVDIDNLCKWVLDVCNEIVYRDDSIVCGILARKLYGNSCTEIVMLPWGQYEKGL